jgi:hypothetical protein
MLIAYEFADYLPQVIAQADIEKPLYSHPPFNYMKAYLS